MTNPYYTVTGAPATQSRGVSAAIRSEYGLIATGFDATYTAMLLRGLKGGETWTGTHVFTGATATFATQSALDSSTKAATTAYADAAVAALAATKADIASPTFTGTPSAPTAASGTSTTQIATTAFVAATAFSSVLPGQTGNSGKFVKTDGTAASWEYAGVASVTTATTVTTLTSTPTLLKITPAGYGVAVTLPDATTCSVGGPMHIIDNKGAYPVRVLNSAGTLLGFIFAGVVSHVSLIDNSTAAGVWTVENSELVGASAQLLTTNICYVQNVIDLGSGRELIFGLDANYGSGTAKSYAVVYDRITNTFGSVTLIRSASSQTHRQAAVIVSTDKILVVSTDSATAFEAVCLTITGTSIAVGAAATATLSANIGTFADGCGLIAVGSSFVCSYSVSGPVRQIRALSISGTTVTIGSAEVLDGTDGGLIAMGDSTHVIAASTATTHLYTKPYLVSGSTLTAGTGTDTNSGTMMLNKLAALGTRWYVGYNDGGSTVKGGVVSLNATGNGTTTIIAATLFSAGTLQDAIIVGSDKVLALNDQTTNNANILTDTAGTASAGTAITVNAEVVHHCLYVNGSSVAVHSGSSSTTWYASIIDCSGSSAAISKKWTLRVIQSEAACFSASNSVLLRSAKGVFGNSFAQTWGDNTNTVTQLLRYRSDTFEFIAKKSILNGQGSDSFRGKSDSERWVTDNATPGVITKLECVV